MAKLYDTVLMFSGKIMILLTSEIIVIFLINRIRQNGMNVLSISE